MPETVDNTKSCIYYVFSYTNWWGAYIVDTLGRGMIHILSGTERDGMRFHQLQGMLYNLKLMNYLFLEFSI